MTGAVSPGIQRYLDARAEWFKSIKSLNPNVIVGEPPHDTKKLLEWGRATEKAEVTGDVSDLAKFVLVNPELRGARDREILAQHALRIAMPIKSGPKKSLEAYYTAMLFLNAIRWHMDELGYTLNKAVEAVSGEHRGKTYDPVYILRRRNGMFDKKRDDFLFKCFQKLRGEV